MPTDRDDFGNVVLVAGFDHTPASRAALTVAIDLAARLHARLHVVHVVELDDYPVDSDAADWERAGGEMLLTVRHEAQTLLEASPVAWTYDQRRGDPVRALTDIAAETSALMIVVGGTVKGSGTVLRHLIGRGPSVADRLERGAVPVLVVPLPRNTGHGADG